MHAGNLLRAKCPPLCVFLRKFHFVEKLERNVKNAFFDFLKVPRLIRLESSKSNLADQKIYLDFALKKISFKSTTRNMLNDVHIYHFSIKTDLVFHNGIDDVVSSKYVYFCYKT
jgi:hypothetical protein